jgi:hypothetical protein
MKNICEKTINGCFLTLKLRVYVSVSDAGVMSKVDALYYAPRDFPAGHICEPRLIKKETKELSFCDAAAAAATIEADFIKDQGGLMRDYQYLQAALKMQGFSGTQNTGA